MINLKKYYPKTPIEDIDIQNNVIIISTTQSTTQNVYDLPIFGKKVIVKVPLYKNYPWMDENGNSKRLNNFVALCCKLLKDGYTIEHILTLSGIRLTPPDYDHIKKLFSSRPATKNIISLSSAPKRGRKTELDYAFIKKVITKLLTTGIPDAENGEARNIHFDNFGSSGNSSAHKPTIRELQEYLKKNTNLNTISLSTIHKIMHSDSKDFMSPDNSFNFQGAEGDFLQKLFDSPFHNYATFDDEYKMLEFKPIKLEIHGTNYSQILTEIKNNERFAFTVSAADFHDKYMEWASYFELFIRLYPMIIILNQKLCFSFATYNTKYNKFSMSQKDIFSVEITKIISGILPDTQFIQFLYTGKRDFGLEHYTEHGALFNLKIPKEGTIEIGISNCLRISTAEKNYLIPVLGCKKHII